jgi:hypothetical protein
LKPRCEKKVPSSTSLNNIKGTMKVAMPTATFRRYLPHYQKDDRSLFVTFRTRKPQKLSPEARTVVLQHRLHDNTVIITLHAAVIMPDHAHLLFTARRDAEGWTFALPEILRAIKGTSATIFGSDCMSFPGSNNGWFSAPRGGFRLLYSKTLFE